MSHESTGENTPAADRAAGRPEFELFCIHSYAGESGPPCGWRGAAGEITGRTASGERRCPRCGRATLMELPPRRSDEF